MLLLDTHMVLWLALTPDRIPAHLTSAMLAFKSDGAFSIAAATLWEIALLDAKGRLSLDVPVSAILERVERAYRVLPMNGTIALRGVMFSSRYPKDPADRQIGATAIVHGLTLVTVDKRIIRSAEVPCLS